jgi:hypothetical protein
METQVRTPQLVFMQPQRLVVPLFQRPYVWNEENQWEPLWSDVARLADRVWSAPNHRHPPHFLGAVVLQQIPKQTGLMQERTIIDGQQRLTTLQLLLDALHAELIYVGAQQPAMRLEPLVANANPFCTKHEDRFKVWPTNRDRAAFNAVMAANSPVNYLAIGHQGERMVEAHRYFGQQAREWLPLAGTDAVQARAAALELVVRELLQIVVIDLAAEENAQEIFETLNARGAQLTAADLIKNFVFQRLLDAGADVEKVYNDRWREFETGFWESEVSVGRLRYPRSALFMNHWLVARTGEDIVAREVFERFKRFCDHDSKLSMPALITEVHKASKVYATFVSASKPSPGPVDRLQLFAYRTAVLESEVVKPLLLCLLDPQEVPIPEAQLVKALDTLESWLVRRMLVRATTKNYNQVIAELIGQLRSGDRANAGAIVERYLASQRSDSRYWPDDAELRAELAALPAYKRLSRGRLRMVLEAIEDSKRGWRQGKTGLGGERVARGAYAIEHVMPRKWEVYWPALGGPAEEMEREQLLHTIGNLTLLTGPLNSKVSNGPWAGDSGKCAALKLHDVLILNRGIVQNEDPWTHDRIRNRTRELTDEIIALWPVPPNHKSGFVRQTPRVSRRVTLLDLISGGVLQPGMELIPRRKQFSHRVATLLADGRIEVDGTAYPLPRDAASAIAGRRIGGWGFFLADREAKRTLRAVRLEYESGLPGNVEMDDGDEEGEDEESAGALEPA